jgi:hypothetical protein
MWLRRSRRPTNWVIRRHPSAGPRPVLASVSTVGVILMLMAADLPWKHAAAEDMPSAPVVTDVTSTVATSSMEEPLRLIGAARRAFARVHDYRCTLIKQERLDGHLTPETVLALEARTEPNSVHLRWQEPTSYRGQEALYVEGKNNGKLRARGAGALGLIGFISLDPDSPRAKGNSKYRISEAGLGYVIERYAAGWKLERKLDQSLVKIDLGEFAGRACIRVEIDHPTRAEGLIYSRCIVWFDQLSSLPVHVENYDWPKDEHSPALLAERFSFVNIQTNVGLADSVFER